MKLYRETIRAIRQVLDKIEANGLNPTPQQIGEVKGMATWARICIETDLTPGEVKVETEIETGS